MGLKILSKKWFLYCTYIVAIVIFFLYYLFPSESIKNYLEFYANQTRPGVKITIESVELKLPTSLKLFNVECYYQNKSCFRTKVINLKPRILSLIGPKKTIFFEGDAYEGSFTGTILLNDEKQRENKKSVASSLTLTDSDSGLKEVSIDAVFFHINTKEMGRLFGMSEGKLTGKLEGTVAYHALDGREKVQGKIKLLGGAIDIQASSFGLDGVFYKSIDFEFEMAEQKLKIKKGILKAEQVNGQFAGYVDLKDSINESPMKIKGTINPKTIKKSGNIISFSGKAGLPFHIGGTLNQPVFSL